MSKTICLDLSWFFHDPSRILQLSEWMLHSSVSVVLTIFSLWTLPIEVRLAAITIEYFSKWAYTPFHFSRTLPLTLYNIYITEKSGGFRKGFQKKTGYLTFYNFLSHKNSDVCAAF